MSSEENFRRRLAVAFFAAVSLNSCGNPRTGPKLIEADGVRYTACDGAIWSRDEGNSKDPGTMTYEVLFKDAQGTSHHLTLVRQLRISDLPSDTTDCKASPPSVGSVPH
jgi:hypothetical protein